ncbi:MAG: hypothetical protein HQK51_10160 [Oligoflexia bacterium]|nr:hypothetical protein [Oligoflexia bacterium]
MLQEKNKNKSKMAKQALIVALAATTSSGFLKSKKIHIVMGSALILLSSVHYFSYKTPLKSSFFGLFKKIMSL